MMKKEIDKKARARAEALSKKPFNKIHDAQAFKSQQIGLRYQWDIFLAIARNPSSNKELLKETGLSAQALAKHLRKLKHDEFIQKDTVRLANGNLKIVWALIPEHIDIVSKAIAEMGEWLPDYLEDSTDETVRNLIKKLDEEYETIAKIWSELLNRLRQTSVNLVTGEKLYKD